MLTTKISNKLKIYRTGYFANTKRYTKVHLVDSKNKPICGVIILPDMSFQFNAGYVELKYVECEHCKKEFNKCI